MKSNDTQQKTIDFGLKVGREIFEKIIADYPELEDDDLRRISIMSALWNELGLYMVINGYSERGLIKELLETIDMAKEERPDWFEDET